MTEPALLPLRGGESRSTELLLVAAVDESKAFIGLVGTADPQFSLRVSCFGGMLDKASLVREAMDRGYPVPDEKAFESANGLLLRLRRETLPDYEAYPGPDGELAIEFRQDASYVLILCESSGDVVVMTGLNGKQKSRVFGGAEGLLDAALLEALGHLFR